MSLLGLRTRTCVQCQYPTDCYFPKKYWDDCTPLCFHCKHPPRDWIHPSVQDCSQCLEKGACRPSPLHKGQNYLCIKCLYPTKECVKCKATTVGPSSQSYWKQSPTCRDCEN